MHACVCVQKNKTHSLWRKNSQLRSRLNSLTTHVTSPAAIFAVALTVFACIEREREREREKQRTRRKSENEKREAGKREREKEEREEKHIHPKDETQVTHARTDKARLQLFLLLLHTHARTHTHTGTQTQGFRQPPARPLHFIFCFSVSLSLCRHISLTQTCLPLPSFSPRPIFSVPPVSGRAAITASPHSGYLRGAHVHTNTHTHARTHAPHAPM